MVGAVTTAHRDKIALKHSEVEMAKLLERRSIRISELSKQLLPYGPVMGVIVAFAAAIIIVNPMWHTAFSDDWAFAQMTSHVLQTGAYIQNAWLAPNSPLHVYLGVAAARLFGFSFGSLRISTLCMLLIALVSFYFLAKEFRLSTKISALLTLILLGSPLVLLMSFTFMSDIAFFALLTVSLVFYIRGFREENLYLMIAGAVAAAASILVRQLGAVVIPALAMTWLISSNRKRLIPLTLAGMSLPIIATIWQAVQPESWAFHWLALTQRDYIQNPQLLLSQAVWRVMVTLQYLALSIMPLIIVALVEVAILIRRSRGSTKTGGQVYRKDLWLIIVFMLFSIGMSLVGTFVMGERGILPLVPWSLWGLTYLPPVIPALLTLLTTLGAVALGRIFSLRYIGILSDRSIPAHEYLLDIVTFGVFMANLVDIQIGDRYFIPLLPYALIVVGRFLTPLLESIQWQAYVISVVMLLVTCLWVRTTLSELAAEWQGADQIHATGVGSEDIFGPNEWNFYQGNFDDYLKSINYVFAPLARDNYFFVWRSQHLRTASYRTTGFENEAAEPGWKVIATFPYQDMLLRTRQVYVLQRLPSK